MVRGKGGDGTDALVFINEGLLFFFFFVFFPLDFGSFAI